MDVRALTDTELELLLEAATAELAGRRVPGARVGEVRVWDGTGIALVHDFDIPAGAVVTPRHSRPAPAARAGTLATAP
jgi:hypothetical protein